MHIGVIRPPCVQAGLDIKHLVYMPVGHVVMKIYMPSKNLYVPSQYLYMPCKACVHCWENNYMPRLKNNLPCRTRNHKSLCALRQDLHAPGMQACLNVEPCQVIHSYPIFDGILPKGPYPPCLRLADRALLAGYPRILCLTINVNLPTNFSITNPLTSYLLDIYNAKFIFSIEHWLNTFRRRQNGRQFPDNNFKCIFLNENL